MPSQMNAGAIKLRMAMILAKIRPIFIMRMRESLDAHKKSGKVFDASSVKAFMQQIHPELTGAVKQVLSSVL